MPVWLFELVLSGPVLIGQGAHLLVESVDGYLEGGREGGREGERERGMESERGREREGEARRERQGASE